MYLRVSLQTEVNPTIALLFNIRTDQTHANHFAAGLLTTFLSAITNYLTKAAYGKGGFIGSWFANTVHHGGQRLAAESGAAAPMASTVRKQSKMNAGVQLAGFFIRSLGLEPMVGRCSYSGEIFLPWSNLSRNILMDVARVLSTRLT